MPKTLIKSIFKTKQCTNYHQYFHNKSILDTTINSTANNIKQNIKSGEEKTLHC